MARVGRPKSQMLPGEIIDGYQIGVPIGRGGMATVHEGRALDGHAVVAIKVMSLELTSDRNDIQRRFFNELVSATKVRHPRIVQVYDFGVTPNDAPYIVMERLHGRTIEEHLEHLGPMEASQCVPKLIEMLDALELAHGQGVVHADIKPSNVFLCHPGTVDEALTILDFGVACRQTGPHGSVMWGGTPRYSPPERLRGAPAQPQVDIFQIGMLLCEMLSGRSLIHANSVRQCLAVHAGGLKLPTALARSPFGPVIQTAIDPDPNRRQATIDELREALVVALLTYQSAPVPLAAPVTGTGPDKTRLYSHSVPSHMRSIGSRSMPSMSYTGASPVTGQWTGAQVVRVQAPPPAALSNEPNAQVMMAMLGLAVVVVIASTMVGSILVALIFVVIRGPA